MLLLLIDPVLFLPEIIPQYVVIHKEIMERIEKIFNDSDEYKLGDLFDVKYGLLEQRFNRVYINKDGKEENVVFIKPSMIKPSHGEIENVDKLLLLSGKPNKTSDVKKNVGTKDLLGPDDFLFTTKGAPMLIDLSIFEWEKEIKLVATHHFISLKPKANILNKLKIDKTFLKHMLKLVAQKKLSDGYIDELHRYKEEYLTIKENNDKRSIKTIIPAVKINTIKDIKIKVPRSIDNQLRLSSTVDRLNEIQGLVNNNIELWHKEIIDINN